MYKYIKTPNLPMQKVKICIVSSNVKSVIDDLNDLSIETLLVPPCKHLQEGISCHADMVCHHLGENRIVIYNYDKNFTEQVINLGFKVYYTYKKLKENYPDDVLLNAARVGKYLICNEKYTDNIILKETEEENTISVSQGYAKCSTLVVNEKSIITSDKGISKKAFNHGIDVLEIEQGHIILDGYNYGFIGGCGALIDKKLMYFTGNINTHPNCNDIKEFLFKKDIKILCGTSNELIDVGSILPIKTI